MKLFITPGPDSTSHFHIRHDHNLSQVGVPILVKPIHVRMGAPVPRSPDRRCVSVPRGGQGLPAKAKVTIHQYQNHYPGTRNYPRVLKLITKDIRINNTGHQINFSGHQNHYFWILESLFQDGSKYNLKIPESLLHNSVLHDIQI